MAKDADGTWSLTVGPLEPEIYEYSFTVDGARVLDTANTLLKTGHALSGNLLEIPGTPPRFDEVQDVPHGSLQVRTYTSTPLKRRRQLYVYLPPQYDSESARRFPVLYLRHGSGDDESTWSLQGHGVIQENLIARGKALPVRSVTNGDTDNTWAGGSSRRHSICSGTIGRRDSPDRRTTGTATGRTGPSPAFRWAEAKPSPSA
jgi:enterochelin esterase family protein